MTDSPLGQRPPARLGPAVWILLGSVSAALLVLAYQCGQGLLAQGTVPQLPQATVDVTWNPPPTRVQVPAGANLQAAINTATPGTTLVLSAGATYAGPINLPNKSGSGWIYIVSAATLDQGSLSVPGQRVAPADAPKMARLQVGSNQNLVTTSPGAHHYYLAGIEGHVTGTLQSAIIQLDAGNGTQPHHIIVARSYLHGGASNVVRRGVTTHGAHLAVLDSYISDIKDTADSQALWAAAGTGPLLWQNNALSAAGENIMTGGADPPPGTVGPSDITIRGNYLWKPTTWRGSSWVIKNLLELKNGRRILIEGNISEHNWAAGQTGFGWLITPRNQDGSCPGCGIQDVTWRYNQLLDAPQGLNISGRDDEHPSTVTERILVLSNQLTLGCLGCSAGQKGDGRMFQFGNGPKHVVVTHNTGTATFGTLAMAYGSPQGQNFTFTNNVAPVGQYGFFGDATGTGTVGLNKYFSPYTFTANALLGATLSQYPSGNFNTFSGQIGTDGLLIGLDPVALAQATACTRTGQCGSVSPPDPTPIPDTTPPTVTLVTPAAGASFQTGQSTPLQGTATDDRPGVGPVSFTVNGVAQASPYTFATAGIYTFVAAARDAAGNLGTSAPRPMTVTDPSPTPDPPVDCVQGAWVLTSLTQSATGFTAIFSRPTLTAPAHGGTPCGQTATTVAITVR